MPTRRLEDQDGRLGLRVSREQLSSSVPATLLREQLKKTSDILINCLKSLSNPYTPLRTLSGHKPDGEPAQRRWPTATPTSRTPKRVWSRDAYLSLPRSRPKEALPSVPIKTIQWPQYPYYDPPRAPKLPYIPSQPGNPEPGTANVGNPDQEGRAASGIQY
jgi:hypothetical protein